VDGGMTETLIRALPILVAVVFFVAACIVVGHAADREAMDKERTSKGRGGTFRQGCARNPFRTCRHY